MNAVAVRQAPEGTLLDVRVQTKASRKGLGPVTGGALKVAVTEAPEKGKANRAVASVVAKALHIAPSRVALVAGEKARTKRLLIHGMTPAEVRAALDL